MWLGAYAKARSRPPSEEPKPAVIQKPEPFKPDEPFEKAFFPSKPIPHPPKITPSSIPNPNPSITANKEKFPNYAGYLYNIPGYSAFQPVKYLNNQPSPTPMQTETSKPDYAPFTITGIRESKEQEDKALEQREDKEGKGVERKTDSPKQQDFEDNFTMKIIPPSSKSDSNRTQQVESKMSIASLSQGSGGTVSIPTQTNKEVKKKPERFSLKTSIPISKIDMKCVSSPVDTAFQNAIKKPVFDSAFQNEIEKSKIEIQSNIVIKTPTSNKETEGKEKPTMPERESLRNIKPCNPSAVQNNSISTLINAAEAINKNDGQFRVPEPKNPANEPKNSSASQSIQRAIFNLKDIPPPITQSSTIQRSMFKPGGVEASRSNTDELTAMAIPVFNPVSAETSKPNPVQPTAISKPIVISAESKQSLIQTSATSRPIFNPVSESKPNFAQPQAISRPMSNSVRPQASKPNSAQSTAVSRPISNPVSSESKPSLTQTSTTSRPMPKPVSAEKKPNLAQTSAPSRPVFNTVNSESKSNFPNKPPDGGYNESKNRMFQNQKNQNPKMLLTIQPNPQVLLQRTNFESKNLQAPSRLSSQSKKSEVLTDTSSKVVALKRLHQDNGDENDFEKLITENQIYGNKIVVKEKSQVTQEEWKNKGKVEKQTEQDWKKQIKIDIKVDKPSENKNVVLQPNFVYLSNVQFPGNLMMIKNNPKICQTPDPNKMQVSPNENITTDITVNNNNVETNTAVKNSKQQIVTNKEIHILKSSNNVLQTLSNIKNNNNKADAVFQTSQKVILTPQVIFQLPIPVTESENKNLTVKDTKVPVQKKDILISKQVETKPDKVIITCQVDANVPKIVMTNLRPKATTSPKIVEEVSMLDVYEQKKRLRRLKYLSNASKDVSKPEPITAIKRVVSTPAIINVVTPDKVEAEIFKEFSQTKEVTKEDGSSDSGSDFDENDLDEYKSIIEKYGADYNENAKVDFLAGFSLASREVFREKQLERHERTLKFDAIASAYMAAGRLDSLTEDQAETTPESQTLKTTPEVENKQTLEKQQFFAHFQLMKVSARYKTDYEKSWRFILCERNKRNGIANTPEPFDPGDQLQMLTEINKSVNDNNDLIKKRLDSICDENSDIRILAEKNFSELNRLSKMADRSVKLFSGKDTKKRDLNPGFDSENIKKFKVDPKHHSLNIPKISKIISPKTDQDATNISSTQATSMDEPSNSASCGKVETKDVGCQSDEKVPWYTASELMEHFIKSYREYEIARKKEIDDYHRTTTRLRVECAHVTRSASRDSDRAQALLSELKHLAGEEASLRNSLERITRVLDIVKNS